MTVTTRRPRRTRVGGADAAGPARAGHRRGLPPRAGGDGAAPAEAGLFNGGSVRVDDLLPAGPFTELDAIRVLPFGGEVVTVRMPARCSRACSPRARPTPARAATSRRPASSGRRGLDRRRAAARSGAGLHRRHERLPGLGPRDGAGLLQRRDQPRRRPRRPPRRRPAGAHRPARARLRRAPVAPRGLGVDEHRRRT